MNLDSEFWEWVKNKNILDFCYEIDNFLMTDFHFMFLEKITPHITEEVKNYFLNLLQDLKTYSTHLTGLKIFLEDFDNQNKNKDFIPFFVLLNMIADIKETDSVFNVCVKLMKMKDI